MANLTKQEIIARLAAHRPVGEVAATRGITVRWLATFALVTLLPMAVYMARNTHPFLADHAVSLTIGLTIVGLLGVFIAWRAATRRMAAERHWGLATLTKDECVELEEISSKTPEIQQIVDHWMEVWIRNGTSPRGRDLAFLREMVRCWAEASSQSEVSSQVSQHA